MIPSDLAARLRLLTGSSVFETDPPVPGTARAREIQARLPALEAGQRYTATLERALPDGTFQALIAGKSYTLALNNAAAAGDTVELVVTKNTPNTVFAQVVPPAAAGDEAAAEAARPTLSAVGRLIGFLLTGQPEAKPAELNGGQPLLRMPPVNGGETLAPVLREALSESGLFYESHQLQWISGKLPTAALLQEPQGQQPAPPPGATSGQAAAPAPDAAGRAEGGTAANAGPETVVTGADGTLASRVLSDIDDQAAATNVSTGGAARATPLPEQLMPVVHQQLDGIASQLYVWHGQVWPGQGMEWEIEDPKREAGSSAGDEPPAEWKTTLRLTLPRLGGLEARLILTPAGVAMRLMADDEQTVSALDGARAQLDSALAAANVPLTGFVAERRDERR